MNRGGPKPAGESAHPFIAEIRYRLPDLLAELKAERSAGLFAQERFSQSEIEKIFKSRKSRHGKRLK
jgi:hypothetical protein